MECDFRQYCIRTDILSLYYLLDIDIGIDCQECFVCLRKFMRTSDVKDCLDYVLCAENHLSFADHSFAV